MRFVIPAVSFFAWVLIEVMVFVDPSGTLPLGTFSAWVLLFYLLSASASFLFPFLAFGRRNRLGFFPVFVSGFLVLLFLAWFGGNSLHRDFYVYATQAIMLYFIIFLCRVNDLDLVKRKQVVYQGLFIGAMVIFALWTAWLMMMAYAIVVRSEPRWIESTAYNLLNGIIGLLMVYAAVMLREHSKRTVWLKGQFLFLDSRNITELLTPMENSILHFFVNAHGHILTCHGLTGRLRDAGTEFEVPNTDCDRCLSERWTASACPVYRNLKKRIDATKKYLELLQIGTIVPVSENPRNIKEAGWCLRLFDDVRLHSAERRKAGRLFAPGRE